MRRRLVHNVLPWMTTLLSLAVTVIVFVAAREANDRRSEQLLAVHTADAATAMASALDRFADVLRAVDGLVGASSTVTPAEFAAFVDALDIDARFPGTEAVTSVRRSTAGGRITVEASVGVHPAPTGSDLDPSRDAPLVEVLDASGDLHSTSMSVPFAPPAAMSTASTAGTRHVVIAHHAAPEQWLLLWLSATALVGDVAATFEGYTIEVTDVTAGAVAPIVTAPAAGASDHVATADLSRFGRRWRVTAGHDGMLVSEAERQEPWILLAGGLLLTAALATTFTIQAAGRRQALALVERASHSEQVRRDLIETAPVAIVEVDEHGIVRSWNSAAGTLLGVPASEAIGRPLDLPVSDEVRRAGLAATFQGLAGARLELSTAAGRRTVTAFTKCDDVRHQVLIMVDETANVALSRQLEQSQKLEVFGRLAGGIAHDFNNLLTPILGYIDMVLLRAQTGEADRAALQEARRAADRAAALVSKLLAVSRPPTGAAAPLDVARTIDDLAGLLTTAASGDVVHVDVPGAATDRPFVRIDRTQFEQVLLNLVVNAHEAMDRPGHISVTVLADAASATVRVVDDGHGMDPTTRAAMFEPFFSTKVERGGSGLGLATVYSIVTGAGGRIVVESERGRGTRIDVVLPRVDPEPSTEPAPAPAADAAHRVATVLLVEDDASVRRLATTILRDHHFQVVPVASAGDALDAFARLDGTIDLVLTDVVLRGASGTELAAHLHARRPDLRVVFMSGYTDGHFGTAGELPPGTRLLPKPFRVDDLVGFVRDALDGAS